MEKRTLMAVTAALLLAVARAPAADAALRISKIHFQPATEDGSRKSLNRERIVIAHRGPNENSLAGWKLHDSGRDHTFVFPEYFKLSGKSRVVLHSGSGEDHFKLVCGADECRGVQHLYWGRDDYVWDNHGDVAKLRNRRGDLKDTCRYTSAASSPKLC